MLSKKRKERTSLVDAIQETNTLSGKSERKSLFGSVILK
jgi:hypothetical protein